MRRTDTNGLEQELNNDYAKVKAIIDDIEIEKENKKGTRAILVMVQNEDIFLPIWLEYYSKYFDGEDIYVLDHNTTDGSVEKCKRSFEFRTIRLDYPYSFDHLWFQFIINHMQKKLLTFYEYVLFTDCDEIILPNRKKYDGLNDYIDKMEKDYVRCKGYELIHVRMLERPFSPGESVLSQRRFWRLNKRFSKPLLSRIPLDWRIGFHHAAIKEIAEDEDLLLIHLHKLDYDMCWKRTVERSRLRWTEEELKTRRGYQNRITDYRKFKEYFYVLPRVGKLPRWLMIRMIPAAIRKTGIF